MVRVTTAGTGKSLAALTRRAIGLLLLAVVAALLWDSGASFLNRLSAQDGVRDAGRAAVEITSSGGALTDSVVSRAYVEADLVAQEREGHIVPDGPQAFRVRPDGAVTLTLTRTAPTVLFKHVPMLRPWAQARETWTATP